MRGLFINCPNREDCGKLLLKDVFLKAGSYLTVKCYHCGASIKIYSEGIKIKLKLLDINRISTDSLTDEEDDIIIFTG